MAGQGPNPNNSFSGQAQLSRDQESHDQSQTNFLQETGTHAKNMAQGATDVGKGAVLGAASLARGAATGVANVATGAADALKNTFGGSGAAPISHPSNNTSVDGSAHSNTNQSAYPNKPSYPHNP
ncbi:hypothetical protein C2S53_010664 [Perilla frutescens var. hirtella]|uniref:Uncharacterized protein n=1 Tax=Perilla frutescens var. hirtella TaxID=608512 RepID=A0AAD4P8K2_PERFH|nr:hypothetical protein C2S53_010664 [Perilla frutescens var. hirtella]